MYSIFARSTALYDVAQGEQTSKTFADYAQGPDALATGMYDVTWTATRQGYIGISWYLQLNGAACPGGICGSDGSGSGMISYTNAGFSSSIIVNGAGQKVTSTIKYTSQGTITVTFRKHIQYCPPSSSISSNSGTLDDGSGSSNYTSYTSCVWTITPTAQPSSGNDVITIAFTQFQLDTSGDFVIIYDGPNTNSLVIANYTGVALPPPVRTSQLTAVTIVFTSNANINYAGWSLSYNLEPFCRPATTVQVDMAGFAENGYQVLTDGSRSSYDRTGTCAWTLQGPPNSFMFPVQLTWTSYNRRPGGFVKLLDKNLNTVAIVVGDQTPVNIYNNGNTFTTIDKFANDSMVVQFDRGTNNSAPSFRLQYTVQYCAPVYYVGGTEYNVGESKLSPGFTNCKWVISPTTKGDYIVAKANQLIFAYENIAAPAPQFFNFYPFKDLYWAISTRPDTLVIQKTNPRATQSPIAITWAVRNFAVGSTSTLTAYKGVVDSGEVLNCLPKQNFTYNVQVPTPAKGINIFPANYGGNFVIQIYSGPNANSPLKLSLNVSAAPDPAGWQSIDSASATVVMSTGSGGVAAWAMEYYAQWCKVNEMLTDNQGNISASMVQDSLQSYYTNCNWQIAPSQPGYIEITVDYNLTSSSDTLSIYGDNNASIAVLQGPRSGKAQKFRSASAKMIVSFKSQNRSIISSASFAAQYTFISSTSTKTATTTPSQTSASTTNSGSSSPPSSSLSSSSSSTRSSSASPSSTTQQPSSTTAPSAQSSASAFYPSFFLVAFASFLFSF